jgi:hypothetical protein
VLVTAEWRRRLAAATAAAAGAALHRWHQPPFTEPLIDPAAPCGAPARVQRQQFAFERQSAE